MVWLDDIKKIRGAQVGETSLRAGTIRIEAALQNSFLKEREVTNIIRKIYSSLAEATFPMTVDVLDGLLQNHVLTCGERIALKSAMSRAGILR